MNSKQESGTFARTKDGENLKIKKYELMTRAENF